MNSFKVLSAATAAVLLSCGSVVTASPVPVDSRISATTVYLDRAIVTRTAQVQLPAGESELIFEKLPAGLLDASLQVGARGTAGAMLVDVSARQTFVEATVHPRIKALEDELQALQRQDVDHKARLALLDQQRALLGRIEAAVTSPPPRDASVTGPRPGIDEWQKLLAFQFDTLSRLSNDQQALDRQREEVAAKMAAVNAQLALLRSRQAAARSFKTVTVRVAAALAGSLDVSLSYAVHGASWTPAYDVRLRSEQRRVELNYFGVVRNGTGEDWNAVALTLSTARPSQGGSAPALPPWIVDVYRPMPRPMAAPAMTSSKVSLGASREVAQMSDRAEEIREMAFDQATVETAATSATFRIATPVTLPSDNSAQRVPITGAQLAATLHYESTPKLLEAAFLNATVTNTTAFPLLAGPSNLFLDDTFVAAGQLRTVMPGEKFDLALGSDDGIAVKRRLVNRFSEETGFTSKGRRVTYEFMVTLTNNKKTAEQIVFKEAVPVSRDEKIVVKLLTPAEREIGAVEGQKEITREADGVLVWRIALKPGEKREFPLKLSVEYPSDITVIGLN